MTTNLINVLAHSLPAYVWGVSGFSVIFLFPNILLNGAGAQGLGELEMDVKVYFCF